MRRALLVTYHFPPSAASGAFRLLGFARYLPRWGWQPVVVAPPRMPLEPVDPRLLEQVPPGTPVYRAPYPEGRLLSPFRRIAPRGVWLPRALAACVRAIGAHRPEVLFTSGPPHCVHLLGLLLHHLYRLPWVADFRDPWVANGPNAARPRRSLWARSEPRLERAVLHAADRILANAPLACEQLKRSYPAFAHKMETLTNGYDAGQFPRRNSPPTPNRPLRVLHTGELYAGRDPRPLLGAIRRLQLEGVWQHSPFRVLFLGRSGDLGQAVQEHGLTEVVETGGQVSYDEAMRQMLAADVLLLLDSPNRRAGVPAKLYEYLGTGRPILSLSEQDGDTAWVLRESGVPHRIASPSDPAAIERALRGLVDQVAHGPPLQPDEARLASFSREQLAGELARILNGCAKRRPSRADTN